MTKKNYYLKRTTGIYVLTHIATGRQYCGQSVDCVERFKQHSTPRKRANGIKGAIMKYGVDAFSFQILEECKREELNEREIWWIAQLGCMSPAGFNLTSGGGQGTFVSEETRAKMSEALKNRAPYSDETRAKISEAGKGRKPSPESIAKGVTSRKKSGYTHSPETLAKIAASRASYVVSDETKARQSEAGKKRAPPSDETRAKIKAAQQNKTMSEEARAKISASKMGMSPSEEARAKISATLTGRKTGSPSDEVKARMSESKRIGWARKKAALAETASYAAPLQKLTDSLRQDKTYVTMAGDKGALSATSAPPPTLEELDALLKEL